MINCVTLSGVLKKIMYIQNITLGILENDDEEYFIYWDERKNYKDLLNKYVLVIGSLSSVRFKYKNLLDEDTRTTIKVRRIECYDF
jgi:uncharacterized protein YutD